MRVAGAMEVAEGNTADEAEVAVASAAMAAMAAATI